MSAYLLQIIKAELISSQDARGTGYLDAISDNVWGWAELRHDAWGKCVHSYVCVCNGLGDASSIVIAALILSEQTDLPNARPLSGTAGMEKKR